jgi:hypothetical protein
VKLWTGKGLFQPSKPNVNRVSKPGCDPSHVTNLGSDAGRGSLCPSALVGGLPKTKTVVEVRFPLVELHRRAGPDMAIVGWLMVGIFPRVHR